MMQVTIPKEQQEAFKNWLEMQGEKTVNKCRYLVVRMSELHVYEAKNRAPVRFGNLRRSIRNVYTADKLGAMQLVDVNYGYFQEFKAGGKVPGTYYPVPFTPPGRHFFYPPFERIKKQFLKELEKLGFKQ